MFASHEVFRLRAANKVLCPIVILTSDFGLIIWKLRRRRDSQHHFAPSVTRLHLLMGFGDFR